MIDNIILNSIADSIIDYSSINFLNKKIIFFYRKPII